MPSRPESGFISPLASANGLVAQLEERLNGIEEVVSSNLIESTISMIETSEDIMRELRASLSDLHPAHVFLFGSHARGTAQRDSDVDVLVVLDTDFVPTDYEQRRVRMLTVRERLLPLNRRFSMDVLVLSKPEWRKLRQHQPEFADSIETTGLAVT